MEKFLLETPSIQRETNVIEFIKEFEDTNTYINGGGNLVNYKNNYKDWLTKIKYNETIPVSNDRVPANIYFFVRQNDNKIIGIIDLRWHLNKKMNYFGGMVGYCIRPSEQGKGYGKINLFLGLLEFQKKGIKRILIDVDKDNVASVNIIKKLNGKIVKEFFEDKYVHKIVQHYTIDIDETIEKNFSKYKKFIYKKNKS